MSKELSALFERRVDALRAIWLRNWHSSVSYSSNNAKAWFEAVIEFLEQNGYEVRRKPPTEQK
jgi:hypothetical protein